MGLNDRDYMRERNRSQFEGNWKGDTRSPFTPPSEGPSLLTIVGAWICVAFVLYKGYGWWLENKGRDGGRAAAVVQQGWQPPETAAPQERRSERQPAPVPGLQAAAPIAPPAQRTHAPAPPPMPAIAEEAPRTGGTIYLFCKNYGDGTFWASSHCNQHRAHIETMVSVPPGMPFEQQVELARQRRAALAPPQPVHVTQSSAPDNSAAQRLAECHHLDERVRALDAQARQALPAVMQDHIREQRKAARDRQFALRC